MGSLCLCFLVLAQRSRPPQERGSLDLSLYLDTTVCLYPLLASPVLPQTKCEGLGPERPGGQCLSHFPFQERMNRMRQRIAQRLKEAQNTCAMLTTFNEIDMR